MLVIARIIRHVLALRTMAGVHSLDERLVLPVETVGSATAVQVVQRKEWLLVDGLAPFEV
jgi:hypothetical protein